jgi:AraC-like DNA-binding protein
VLPSANVTLMVNLHEDEFRTYDAPGAAAPTRTGGAVLIGPRGRPTVIDTEEQRGVVEVTFTLGAALALFGVPVSELEGRLVELGALWGRDGRLLRERLLDAATPERRLATVERVLCAHLAANVGLDPAVAHAAAAFDRGLSVAAVAADAGMAPKRFARRFRERVGLAPKRYSRVRRLQRVIASIGGAEPVRWADVAAAHGFFDQAHLVNEFRELTGVTPAAYRARSAAEPNHVPVD